MKKILREWGGAIIMAIAIMALIGLVAVLILPGGALDGAFYSITNSFIKEWCYIEQVPLEVVNAVG